MTEPASSPPRANVEALELLVEVLASGGESAGEAFYDRLCAAVCRLAQMRRAVIFRYDTATRRVRAAGAHGLDLAQFEGAFVTVESLPISAKALREDRVVAVHGDVSGEVPPEYAALFPEPVWLLVTPMA